MPVSVNSVDVIRDARPEDAAALCRAAQDIARHHDERFVSLPGELNPASFQERITAARNGSGSGKYLVIEHAGELIAHASLFPMPMKRLAHVLRLDMCVHLGCWRQGHGKRLLDALVDWARNEPGVHKIELLVRATNQAAITLYKQAGFFEEGRHRDRIKLQDRCLMDDIAMAMMLKAPPRSLKTPPRSG
jgi:L-phenylalanine/L-methionine N-acetyltransferase